MWANFATRFALVSLTCMFMAAVATVGLLFVPDWIPTNMSVKLRLDLWLMALIYLSGCGFACFCLYALREMAKHFVSPRFGFQLGFGFAVVMWAFPFLGSALGVFAWLLQQTGDRSFRVVGLGLAGFLLWTASFVAAGALLLEPNGNARRLKLRTKIIR